jgi:hypothetical protein
VNGKSEKNVKPSLRIDPKAAFERSAHPHEPIAFTSEVDRAAFAERVFQNATQLFDILQKAGYIGSTTGLDDSGVDFYLNQDAGTFRMLSLVIKSRKMITSKLIPLMVNFLQGLSEPYSIDISCDIDVSLELFSIHVTQDEAVAAFEVSKTAKAFGFDPRSPLIGPIS